MKKLILFALLIIVIPFIIVSILKEKDTIKFISVSNTLIRVKNEKTGKITKIPFEEYIVGVVSGEVPTSFEMEALKAQAVVARSYALFKMNSNQDKKYDVVNTVSNQVYLDDNTLKKNWGQKYDDKINRIKKAVISTKNEYLDYKGKIVQAYFFSTSTGVTENSEEIWVSKLPYLRSVKSSWDKKESPVFNSNAEYSLSDFYQKLDLKYNKELKIDVLKKTSTGRTKQISINNVIFKGEEVTAKLGLRSNYFEIKKISNNVNIKVKGYGHGVGMSQYGANGMAKAGYKYENILKYYYKGVSIKKF